MQSEHNGLRLYELRKNLHLKQAKFADMIGASRSALSQIETGSRSLNSNIVIKVKQVFPNVNMDWLLSGTGEMFLPEAEKPPEKTDDCEERLAQMQEALNAAHQTIHNLSVALRQQTARDDKPS